tara:strand:- start:9309 stop:9695 length:387 start_codon:yes stop_codon:yes gene_type:complete
MDTQIIIRPNLQLIYVSNIEKSTLFYKNIFNLEPTLVTPRYVAFSVMPTNDEVTFALWTGADFPDRESARFSEIGIMLRNDKEVEKLYQSWSTRSEIHFEQEIYADVFGLTFLIRDPDGHIIRVCSVD